MHIYNPIYIHIYIHTIIQILILGPASSVGGMAKKKNNNTDSDTGTSVLRLIYIWMNPPPHIQILILGPASSVVGGMALELILGWAFSQLALPGRNIERTHSMREYIQYICTLALPGRNSCACSVYHLCKKKQNWCSVYCLCKFMFSMFSMQTEYSACLVYRLCKVKWYSVCCLCKHYTHSFSITLHSAKKKKSLYTV